MQTQSDNLKGLIEIEPPAVPYEGWHTMSIVGIVVVLMLLLLILALKKMLSHKVKSRRLLRKLTSDFKAGKIEKRASLFNLVKIMKTGFVTKKIAPATIPLKKVKNSQQRWQNFVEKLEAARFAKQDPDSEVVKNLLSEARYWLN